MIKNRYERKKMNQAKAQRCSDIRRRHLDGHYIRNSHWRGYEQDERPSWDKRVQRHVAILRKGKNV